MPTKLSKIKILIQIYFQVALIKDILDMIVDLILKDFKIYLENFIMKTGDNVKKEIHIIHINQIMEKAGNNM